MPACVVILVLLWGAAASAVPAPGSPHQETEATSGRVAATVTTLEGTVQMPGVQVELRDERSVLLAITTTDGGGRVLFPDVPAGRYTLTARRAGFFDDSSAPFDVRLGQTASVLLDIRLTFTAPTVDVRAERPASDSVQPVSMSDMLDGTLLDTAPLQGDDFQNLLPLLPGVVRSPDGRLRVRGSQPAQSALQISTASLNDPSTGDFDLDLPSPSVESVEVLANPFAAEYGRFSAAVTQIRTRRGTNDWEFKPGNLMPRFRGDFSIRGFEPRFSVRGPLRRDRAFLAYDVQFRYLATPVRSLPGEPDIALRSFDSFTRIDMVLSSRHTLVGGLIAFPREVEYATLSTFRPPPVTPDLDQNGAAAGLQDRIALTPNLVLESTLSTRRFRVDVGPDAVGEMVYQPQTQSGTFFNRQGRDVGSIQWVESLSLSREWHGEHVFKVGSDLQWAAFDGTSESAPIDVRRLDGTLAERTVFEGRTQQAVSGVELAMFAQDRWRIGARVTVEAGLRFDRDPIVQRINWSPRAGVALALLPEGRGILRLGVGKFVGRSPLNVGAFASYEDRIVTRYDAAERPLGPAVRLTNVADAQLSTPYASVATAEWNQRFGRRLLWKAGIIGRRGVHEFVVDPRPEDGEMRLSSRGTSRYTELENTVRYLGNDRRDISVSYVWSEGLQDLNGYDQFYGNFRAPIIRPSEYNLSPLDVRHRVLVRATVGLPGQWDFAPVLELRSGFPWSAVNEYQDFVGPRNRTGRLPAVRTLDFQLTRLWRFRKYQFRAGVRVYNAFGSDASRDIQANVTAPDYGTPYNPIERSIGVVFGTSR